MKGTTILKFLYIFELTAPVFYRVKGKFISDPEEKKMFKHFEDGELPHSPEIKFFLKENYNLNTFPIPDFIFEWGAAVVSFFIAIWGKKAIYYFEYLFENKAVHVYTNLVNKNPADKLLQEFAQKLCDEELVHLNYFKAKLGKK